MKAHGVASQYKAEVNFKVISLLIYQKKVIEICIRLCKTKKLGSIQAVHILKFKAISFVVR